jgi:uncharacterized membrane protein
MATNKLRKHRDKHQADEQVDEDLEPQVAEIVRDLPKEEQKVILRALSVRKNFSGPLPDGDTIRVYAEVIPDGGDRLMNTVEKQLEHRIQIEKAGVDRSFNQSSTGQWMAFLIALVFGFIAWDLARNGQTTVATILGSIDLVALVTVFVTGRVTK